MKNITELVYCGFGRRFAAILTDIAIITMLFGVVIIVPEVLIKFSYLYHIGYYFVYALIPYFWFFFYSDLQSSLGMYIFKIKVVAKGRNKIGFFQALLRSLFVVGGIVTILVILFTVLFGTDFLHIAPIVIINFIFILPMVCTQEKTALHDLISKTRVVIR
ncbi:MAG: RDD family protein [Lutibacter sp.]|nr:RDD family protein [Lutibacter sp.]